MKRFYYSFITLLAAVVLLASCSKEKDGTACLKLIPGDAAVVMRLDLKQMGDALGYDKEAKDKLKEALKSLENAENKEVHQKFEAIIDNPSELGISTEHPVYFYVAPNMSNLIGLVGTVSDKDKIIELIESGKKAKIEETDGVSYVDAGGVALFVADDWFLIGMTGDDAKSMAKDLKELADGDKTPVMENEDFKALMEKKGLCQMLISGRGLNAFVGKAAMFGGDVKEIKDVLNKVMPGKLADMSLLADVSFSKGVSEGTTELLPYSQEWKNAVADFDAILGKVTPAVAQYLSSVGITVLANADGSKLMELIAAVAAKFDADVNNEEFNEVRALMNTVKGDMGLNVTEFNNDHPDGAAYVSTKDASIVDLITKENGGNELKKNGENDYTLFDYSYDWDYDKHDFVKTGVKGITNIGYQQGYTYFVFSKDLQAQPFTAQANPFPTKNIKGKGIYFYMDYGFIADIETGNSTEELMMKEVAKLFDYAEAYYEGNGKFVGRAKMKDQNTSLINIYINLFEQFLSQNSSQAWSYDDDDDDLAIDYDDEELAEESDFDDYE